MKHYIYSLAATFITAALAMGSLTACSEVDNAIENAQQLVSEAPVYHVSIPATMGGEAQTRAVSFDPSDMATITSSFAESENVYVYNKTKQVFACNSSGEPIALHPSNISSDGQCCTLTGELTFYKRTDDWHPVEVGTSDTYDLYYQMNALNAEYFDSACFDYRDQAGTTAGVTTRDFAEAKDVTLTKSGNTLTVGDATFQPLQAMFRQTLTFKDSSTTVTPTITRLRIMSWSEALINEYYPLGDEVRLYYNVTGLDGSDLYAALRFNYDDDHPAASDKLVVWAEDADGYAYKCVKAAPTGGFVSGKYYYGTMTLNKLPKLTVTYTEIGTENVVNLEKGGTEFSLDEGLDYIYTISGAGFGDIVCEGPHNVIIADGTEVNDWFQMTSNDDGFPRVILGGNATFNWDVFVWGPFFTAVTSPDGPHTLTINNASLVGNLRLCENVTLLTTRVDDESTIKNGAGTDITPTEVTVNGKKYKQYVGAGLLTRSVKVYINKDITSDGGFKLIYKDGNQDVEVNLTGGNTCQHDNNTYYIYTADIPYDVTSYKVIVIDQYDSELAWDVNPKNGNININDDSDSDSSWNYNDWTD